MGAAGTVTDSGASENTVVNMIIFLSKEKAVFWHKMIPLVSFQSPRNSSCIPSDTPNLNSLIIIIELLKVS